MTMESQQTNMDDVSMFVHHDVAIVSVFDLEEITDQRIGCHTTNKVSSSLREERWGYLSLQ